MPRRNSAGDHGPPLGTAPPTEVAAAKLWATGTTRMLPALNERGTSAGGEPHEQARGDDAAALTTDGVHTRMLLALKERYTNAGGEPDKPARLDAAAAFATDSVHTLRALMLLALNGRDTSAGGEHDEQARGDADAGVATDGVHTLCARMLPALRERGITAGDATDEHARGDAAPEVMGMDPQDLPSSACTATALAASAAGTKPPSAL
mmetsp:Transcript_11834/g.42306  ORF Transcript_11834/g.42306 Transcript_11834/m.42306 type:complete len:208 (+) Transcript_11834:150-773(+)